MCTLILLRRPASKYPVLVAANRDEALSRPWLPPGRHWPDRPEVVAGRDGLAGGSWLGLNDHGVVAAVLNRVGTLGPASGKRSRGELVLDALDYEAAGDAAEALAELDPGAYRPFNLIIADADDAFWLRHAGEAGQGAGEAPPSIDINRLPAGLSMVTACDVDDAVASPRIALHRPRFAAAPVPDPDTGDWSPWTKALASSESGDGDPRNALTIVTDHDYGTVCSSLIAIPAEGPPELWFAAGRPGEAPFERLQR